MKNIGVEVRRLHRFRYTVYINISIYMEIKHIYTTVNYIIVYILQ
jgi:hypothetical protein